MERSKAALFVGEDMAAIAKALVVIFVVHIGMPEIDERTGDQPAGPRQHHTRQGNHVSAFVRLAQVAAPRRVRLVERPIRLPRRRYIAVVALRRRRESLPIGRRAGRDDQAGGGGTGEDLTTDPDVVWRHGCTLSFAPHK